MLSLLAACNNSTDISDSTAAAASTNTNLTISGTLSDAQNMTVYFDRVQLNEATEVYGTATADAQGHFNITATNPVGQGIYRLRVGAQRLPFVLDGTEQALRFEGTMANFRDYDYTMTGSQSATTYQRTVQQLISRQMDVTGVANFADTTTNALNAAYVTMQALGRSAEKDHLLIHKKVQQRMAAEMKGSDYAQQYSAHVANVSKTPIAVGYEAPDISLPGVDDQVRSLSDLKGKVVLLDFWASWCGPCRRENPNVVSVYNKYKAQGFDVFSVSLDRQGQKNRWIQAIEADGLAWDGHVSDLKFWQSVAAKQYGITSIPRTFLLDRDGVIRYVNPRGGQLEPAVKELLAARQ